MSFDEVKRLGLPVTAAALPPFVPSRLRLSHPTPPPTDPHSCAARRNWDLKRDMEPQMKKLRGMTDRAIVELIRQRVAEESGEGADLSLAVEQQQRAEARADED